MLIFYDPSTLAVRHVVTTHGDDHRTWALGQSAEPCVESAEAIAPELVVLTRDAAGEVVVGRRTPMAIAGPRSGRTGAEASFVGVPEGTTITCNGKPLCVMDDSGVLEFTPGVGATYRLLFRHPAHVPASIDYESIG